MTLHKFLPCAMENNANKSNKGCENLSAISSIQIFFVFVFWRNWLFQRIWGSWKSRRQLFFNLSRFHFSHLLVRDLLRIWENFNWKSAFWIAAESLIIAAYFNIKCRLCEYFMNWKRSLWIFIDKTGVILLMLSLGNLLRNVHIYSNKI